MTKQQNLSQETSENLRPLVLFTNDDGIASPGLWASVAAFADFADVLVVAPREQQSGTGRSMPSTSEGRIYAEEREIGGSRIQVYAVDGTPAQAVQHGVIEMADRLPSLVVSGINYGENCGSGVTISGTVGAALEASSMNIPSLAISQTTRHDLHLTYSQEVDFSAAAQFARRFGLWMMSARRPDDVDVLKIDIPLGATPDTEWKVTRISRHRVYWPTRPERVALGDIGRIGYHYEGDPSKAEPNSDVYVVLHEKLVSVTPMSLDMTSRTDMFRLDQAIRSDSSVNGSEQTGQPVQELRRKARLTTVAAD
ncbi:MAG: 5'/3'-nucleotidase SurE [Anaerolineae bacterium]|nr:5'/3'-nucleotidase SurE [Anaerolineae bacterium]